MTRYQIATILKRGAVVGSLAGFFALLASSASVQALELDWSGQFRAEYNYLHNYTADSSDAGNNFDATRAGAGGYYIPSAGSSDATFETLFLRLRPKVVVNDNIYIKSEFWLGDPVYGLFGNGVPYSTDQRQYYSNQNRGSIITAQRFWAEFLTDIGTVQVGRAPLNWGLGLVWSNGEGIWDRYESTGDTIRLTAKFGAFSLIPSFISYSTGNAVGGTCNFNPATGLCTASSGSGGVAEYSLALKYENIDEDFEGGINFIKRLAGAGQDNNTPNNPPGTNNLPYPAINGGYLGPLGTAAAMNYNIWDLFARKRFGKFTLGAEVPITSGVLGTNTSQGLDYTTIAAAVEAGWKISDTWEMQLKGGHAPGQPAFSGAPTSFKAFFFNPNYQIGNIMFHYQLANFAGVNTQNNPAAGQQYLRSPFDNPIVNANYLSLAGLLHTDKWTFNLGLIYAQADQTAKNGLAFYNNVSRSVTANAVEDQASSLGFETDLGAGFQWDEYFNFRLDTGVWLPGAYYRFSNSATAGQNQTSPVYSVSARVGVSF